MIRTNNTAMLHMIAGLDVPDSGDVYVDGADISRMTPSQLTVSDAAGQE